MLNFCYLPTQKLTPPVDCTSNSRFH